MKKIIVLFTLLTFALVGCKDDNDSTGPSSNTGLIPLEVGNWWEYERYIYETSTEEQGDKQGSTRLDVIAKTTFLGKDAYQIIESSELASDTSYMAIEDGALYLGGHIIEIQPELAPYWVKVYDPDSTSWVSMDIEFSYYDDLIKFIGNATNEGEATVSIDGNNQKAVKIEQTTIIETTTSYNGQTQTQKYTITQEYLLVIGYWFRFLSCYY